MSPPRHWYGLSHYSKSLWASSNCLILCSASSLFPASDMTHILGFKGLSLRSCPVLWPSFFFFLIPFLGMCSSYLSPGMLYWLFCQPQKTEFMFNSKFHHCMNQAFRLHYFRNGTLICVKQGEVPCCTSLMGIAACRVRLFNLLINQLLKHYCFYLGL